MRAIFIVFALLSNLAQGVEIEGQDIAKSLSESLAIPFEQSAIRDLRDSFARESGREAPAIAFRIYHESDNFIPIQYSFGIKGTAVQEEISDHFKKFASLPTDDKNYGVINKSRIMTDATAYVGSIWGVKGGFAKVAYVEWPQQGLELALVINDPRELSIQENESNREHLKLISKGLDDVLLEKLTGVFERTHAEYSSQNIERESAKKELVVEHPKPTTAKAETPDPDAELASFPWIWIGAITVIAGVVAFLVFQRQAGK